MIKLLSIVEEITNEQKATSWLKPDGEFIYVEKQHGGSAIKLAGTTENAMNVLFRRGWFRVTYYTKESLYAHNPLMSPNDIQKRNLIELAQELNFEKLVWDNDEDGRVLWSINDVL